MNVNKLKGKIVEKGTNIEALAALLGIDRTTLYRKIGNNNGEKITIGEASKLKEILEMTDSEAIAIFFSDKVA